MTAYTQISANRFKTWLIMLGFAFFISLIVYIFTNALGFRGPSAIGFTGIALIIAGVMNFVSYFYSDRMVMAISRAKQIKKSDNPTLFRTVENLCIAAGLPMPKIYIITDSAPNAFATGRNPKHAAIAFTTGILEKLNKLELEGVTAHELSHVGNYDTRLMTIVAILVGTIALLADMYFRATWFGMGRRDDDRNSAGAIFAVLAIVMAILAPIIGTLIQLSISRKRELLADASGALLTRNPQGLATALLKISKDSEPLEVANRATAHLYIVNPFKGKQLKSGFANLFNTHPPVEERVSALRAMG
ncbi:MAG: M48 family metallopeptidase [Candidatus Curtissbacteria bacterium]|nr:M48 family metallopeptidase [Candidatus Curtissbacteria bacterium]